MNAATEREAVLKDLVTRAVALEKWPVAQLVSLFERNTPAAGRERAFVLEQLVDTSTRKARIIGITGTPGAGKSSLIGRLCMALLERSPDFAVAVIAIDPSSTSSGGALLGDRTRTKFPVNEKRLFFRSQASDLDLGGMGRQTFQVVRLLRHLFDLVIIETVGIGQSETEVDLLSDQTILVMQPLAGDQVQFMKAGIMEVPDAFVINKCDEDALARKSYHLLKSSLKLANIHVDEMSGSVAPIFLTSATKQKGIDALVQYLLEADSAAPTSDFSETEKVFLEKWVKEKYGLYGTRILQAYLKRIPEKLFRMDHVATIIEQVLEAKLPTSERLMAYLETNNN